MNEILERIEKTGIVPVVVLEDAEKAVPVAKALQAGGIDCAEVTFRTAAAEEAIGRIAAECPSILLGAGTVLSVDQVKKAVGAGAKFIVTPGFNPSVVSYCVEHQIPVVPGCMDTNAIEMALEMGLDTVKFFPAEAAGGLKMMKALAGPYVNLKFIPTGGVGKDNLCDYLSFRKVIACGGSWMVKGDLVRAERYDEIERLSREAVAAMLHLRIGRIQVGSMCENPAEHANLLHSVFLPAQTEEGAEAEGCIEILTDHLERALYHLEKQGIAFDMDTAVRDGKKMRSVDFKKKAGEFRIRLAEK